MKKFINYSKSPFFVERNKEDFNWYYWLRDCNHFEAGEGELSHAKTIERLLEHIGYGVIQKYRSLVGGPNGSEYTLISYADVSNPADYNNPQGRKNPFVLDHEFLYLSNEHRKKSAWEIIKNQIPKDEEGLVIPKTAPNADYCISMYEFRLIVERQFNNPEENVLACRNHFFVRSDKGFPFRIFVYYQKKTPKRYPKETYRLSMPFLGFDLFDSTHNNIAGNRVFFSCGSYSFNPR